jgi:HEAT repeat protein
MSTEKPQGKLLGFIVRLQAAIRTVRLYPPSSPLIASCIDALLTDMDIVLEDRNVFLLAESENSLIVDGAPLNRKNQTRDQAVALLQLFRTLGIKSLSFSRGLAADEVRRLVELLSTDPRELAGETLQNRLSEKPMPHIGVNQKVFVAVDKDSQILPSLQIKDEEIVRYFTGDEVPREEALEKMRSMARNPRWIADVFASGLERIATRLGPAPNASLSASVGQLLKSVDRVIDRDNWAEIAGQLADRVSRLDMEAIVAVTVQNAGDHLGDTFFKTLADHLDNDKFQALTDRLEALTVDSGMPGPSQPEKPEITMALRQLMDSEKGRRIKAERVRAAAQKAAQPHYTEGFKAKLSKILRDDFSPLVDGNTADTLAKLVGTLIEKKKHRSALQIVDALVRGLEKGPPEMSSAVAKCLDKIMDGPASQPDFLIAGSVTRRLTHWLKRQKKSTPALQTVCNRLAGDARRMILSGNCAGALPAVEAFAASAENPQGEAALRACGREALEKLAENEIQNLLLDEMDTNTKGCREAACRILTCLGPLCVQRLLGSLRNSRTGQERVRVLKVIAGIGSRAAPFVRRAMEGDEPWYFLRNLTRLLGEIGDEQDLDILTPLLDHEEFRVQWQALNSIYQIGGRRRGELLLGRLAAEEDPLKIHIVTMLGELRQREAVPALVNLLEKKSLVNSEERVRLQKKACLALGKIGSPLAIPVLSEIARGGKLTRMRPYHPKVREAARRSLHSLQMSCASPSSSPVCRPASL